MQTELSRTIKQLRILYPIWVVVGMFSIMYVPSVLIQSADAMATSKNITNNLLLFRFGILGSIITQLLFIIIPLLLYRLFEKIDRNQAVLMVVLALVSVPITIHNEINKILIIGALDQPEEMQHLLEIYYQGMNISMIFWGLWLLPLGWLAFKSRFFPKIIGILLFIAGVGYVLGSFTEIVVPEANTLKSLFEWATFGEIIFIIWLVLFGVKTKTDRIESK